MSLAGNDIQAKIPHHRTITIERGKIENGARLKGRDSLATDIHLFQSTRPKGIRITQLRTIAPIFPSLPKETLHRKAKKV